MIMKNKVNMFRASIVLCSLSLFLVATTTAMDGERLGSPLRVYEASPVNISGSEAGSAPKKGNVANSKHATKKRTNKSAKVGQKVATSNKKIHKRTSRTLPTCYQEGGWGCFAQCLSNSVPMDVVLACAEACSSGQYGTCAGCLGVGISVVVACGYECLFEIQ